MKKLAAPLLALALAAPAAADDLLPPPPPPPSFDSVPLPPPPPGTERYPTRAAPPRTAPGATPISPRTGQPVPPHALTWKPGTIGEGPVAPAGEQAAALHPDEAVNHWRFSLASGVLARFGGYQISSDKQNSTAMLYFGGQADGLWTEGIGQAARLRFRLMVGGETELYLPSDGEVEAAYMIGRREFRFVIGRAEVMRSPGLAVQTLAQVSTLPAFEGSVALANDTMRLAYFVAPVEVAWVTYFGGAHITSSDPVKSETQEPAAATAARLRYTVLLPPSVLLSMQGDLVSFWKKPDLLMAAEGGLGYQVLEQSVTFNAVVRWSSYTRRSKDSASASETASDLQLMGTATLAF